MAVALVRRKGYIDRVTLAAITVIACLPMVLALSRMLALPAIDSSPLTLLAPLRALGALLNQHLVFDRVPPGDRPTILYLLLLPTGALLVAVFRLTLGIRVLGLRAILLAIGFQAIGILPSLALMLIVIGSIVLIRPWVRQIRMPMYARIAFVLCFTVTIMIGAALVGPLIGSETVWRVAFFPVIIMAMLAEGVAKTLEQDDAVMATWRGAWTTALALLLSLIDGPASRLSYQFPELTLTPLMAIVLIAELFDLRLLEAWPARLSRYLAGARPWYTARPRVAVVQNRDHTDRIGALGRPAPPRHRERSHQSEVDALSRQGFEVKVFEGDMRLLGELARYLAPDPRGGTPGGIVLNLAAGIRGEGRFSHVPAMLEIAGVPYTGPGPLAHARMANRFALLTLLQQAQVPVPRHYLVSDLAEALTLEFPAAVRPRSEPDLKRTVVRDRRSLRDAVRRIQRAYGEAAVVEEIIRGRAISVALLGNEIPECLPLVESLDRAPGKACPAALDESVADQVRALAHAAFRAVGCRDYARVDLRLSPPKDIVVVDVRWADLFSGRGAFLTAAHARGYRFGAVLRRIITEAARRYVVAAGAAHASTNGESVVSLAGRRAGGAGGALR